MRTSVKVYPTVESYVTSLATEPRRRLTLALKALAQDRGDIKQLEGKLEGYSRLRVTGHRVIFRERADRGERVIDCIFAEKRAIIYDLFIKLAAESLGK